MAGQMPRYVFRTPTRPGWHRHHLLPSTIRQYPDLRDFISDIAGSGAGLDDFATNGMFLPAEETLATAAHLPLHRGPHRNYNSVVLETLETLRQGAARMRLTGAGRIAAVRGLQRRLHALLRASALDAEVELASRDPFGLTVAGAKLDRRTDAMVVASLSEGERRASRSALSIGTAAGLMEAIGLVPSTA
jgi:A nuclease family of the HNH/ENDO VII superfamily with conserved AHH